MIVREWPGYVAQKNYAAALAANFGLWALLMHAGIGFLIHPQAWVIPLGVILLVAEHVHRERLPAEGAQALRYLGIEGNEKARSGG